MRVVVIVIRSFVPMNPFYTNFLVESKAFTNTEVSNQIAPWYFYSSMAVMIVCKSILHTIGVDASLVCVSGLYFLNLLLLLNLKKRSFGTVRLIYSISGFIAMYDVILRLYVAESNTRYAQSDVKSSYLGLLRAISGSVGCWVGQDIFIKMGSYEINIIISSLTQFLGFLVSLYSAMFDKKVYKYADINMAQAVLSMDSIMTCAFLAGSLCDCFNIFTKLFVHNILRDRVVHAKHENVQSPAPQNHNCDSTGHAESENAKNHATASYAPLLSSRPGGTNLVARFSNIVVPVVYLPIHWISSVLIFSVCFFFPKYMVKNTGQDAKRLLKSGNLDALINILCYYATYLITQYTPIEYKEKLYIFFLLVSSLSLLLMTMSENRIALYFMYLSTSTFSKCAHSFTKVFLTSQQLENNLVVACYISETVLHVTISQICKLLKANSLYKAKFYGYFGLCVFGLILCIKLVK